MTKLHSLAFYALVPVLTFGAGSVLAQQSTTGQNTDRQQMGTQQEQGVNQSTPKTMQNDQARMQNRGYINTAPTNGTQASDLIGAEVSTAKKEDIGSVKDLIIDESGQVVAIVVSVGGFLGMGEKDVAIGWGNVTRSGSADDQKLRVDVTRENLRSAPEFEQQD